MKKFLFILFFYSSASAQIQIPFYGSLSPISNLTPPQIVTDKYITLVGASNADGLSIKKAVRSLEETGIYNKLISLNIGKYTTSGKCYNLIIPTNDSGSFMLTVKAGSVPVVSAGLQVGTGDTLDTHFINDLAHNAPFIGAFWITDIGVQSQMISSASPFNIFPYDGGTTAYVNIWSSTFGVAVPAPPAGFSMAQRYNTDTLHFYQGVNKYIIVSSINSSGPSNNKTFIPGGPSTFVLKVFGLCETLSQAEVGQLKQILDQLLTDLGI